MPLRVLLVGSGFVTPFHLRGWLALEDLAVVGIVSRNPKTAKERAETFGIPATFADLGAALDQTKPDVVDLCTPVESHADQIRQAAAHGTHVMCQKPLATSLVEAIEAAANARRAGIRLMVHENFRFRPWYLAAKRLLEAGAIGEPIYFRSDCRLAGTVRTAAHPDVPWSLERQPFFAGLERFLLLESVIHQIDVARFLIGEPTGVYARVKQVSPLVRGEDLVSLILTFEALHAVIERSYASKGYEDPPTASEDVWIEGTDGLIHVDRQGRVTLVEDRPSGRRTHEIAVDRDDAYARSYAATIAHFIECLRAGRPFETAPEDNLRTLDATFAAYRSAETGEAVRLPSDTLVSALHALSSETR